MAMNSYKYELLEEDFKMLCAEARNELINEASLWYGYNSEMANASRYVEVEVQYNQFAGKLNVTFRVPTHDPNGISDHLDRVHDILHRVSVHEKILECIEHTLRYWVRKGEGLWPVSIVKRVQRSGPMNKPLDHIQLLVTQHRMESV